MNITPLHKRSFEPQPMSKDLTLVMISLSLSSVDFDEMKKDFAFQLIEKRLKFHEVEADDRVIAFVACLCKTPGISVMYCHSLAHIFVDTGEKVTLESLANAYPMGFLHEDDLNYAWDEQKDGGANGLDNPENWPTFKAE